MWYICQKLRDKELKVHHWIIIMFVSRFPCIQVFQCLLIEGENCGSEALRHAEKFVISDDDFRRFVERHSELSCLVPESNEKVRKQPFLIHRLTLRHFLSCGCPGSRSVVRSFVRSVSPSVSESVSESVSQSVSQWVIRLVGQLVSQSVVLSVGGSILVKRITQKYFFASTQTHWVRVQ